MQRAGMTCSIENYARLYEQAQALGYGEIHFQVFGDDWATCAEDILSIGPSVFVKIPAVAAGLAVVNRIDCPDRVTLTAIYSASQIMVAESLGVAYAAPYYAPCMKPRVMQPQPFRPCGKLNKIRACWWSVSARVSKLNTLRTWAFAPLPFQDNSPWSGPKIHSHCGPSVNLRTPRASSVPDRGLGQDHVAVQLG